MKNNILLSVLALLLVSLSSCEAIEGIFKVGLWTGIIIVVLGLIIYQGMGGGWGTRDAETTESSEAEAADGRTPQPANP